MILISFISIGIISVSYVSTYNANLHDYTNEYQETVMLMEDITNSVEQNLKTQTVIDDVKLQLEINTFITDYDLINQNGQSLFYTKPLPLEPQFKDHIHHGEYNNSYYEEIHDQPHLVRKIVHDNQPYYLIVKTRPVNKLVVNNAHVLEVFPLMILIIIMIVIRLQRRFSKPIHDLMSTMREVPRQEDFSIRHHYDGEDEIKVMVDGFNEMLGQLQALKSTNNKNQEQLWELSHIDTLSGFPNRIYFKDLLAKKIEEAKRYNFKVGVFYIDLNNFKGLNDALGRDKGDLILKQASQRLKESLRNFDMIAKHRQENRYTISRMGGDEFLVFVPHIHDVADLKTVANRILSNFEKPFYIDGAEYNLSLSMGISIFPEHGHNVNNLMTHADIAMMMARREDKEPYLFFKPEMLDEHFSKMMIEKDLQTAARNNEFVLFYQPKCDAQSKRLKSFEALIRWNHPQQGMIFPDNFIPVAEENGIISDIGRWTINQACTQCAQWQTKGLKGIGVAVNLSPEEFSDDGLYDYILGVLKNTRLDPRLLEIEITEGTLFSNSTASLKLINRFKALGIKIAIDDFGAGYTSLKYLSHLPIDTLKIDRYFISGIDETNKNFAIVKSIIELAHNLGVEVVAEGVETEQDRSILVQNNCDVIQGYLISKPQPIEAFIQRNNQGGNHESVA